MNRNYIIFLIITVLLFFNSCVITRDFDRYPRESNYEYSGERPIKVSSGFSEIPGNYYSITLFLRNRGHVNRDNIIQYIHIEECNIKPTLGRSRDLLDKVETVRLIYGNHKSEPPYKTIGKIQPQFIDGKKVLHIDGIDEDDVIEIIFKTKNINFISSLHLNYAFTVVWKNSIEERHQGSFLFKRVLEKWYWFTV